MKAPRFLFFTLLLASSLYATSAQDAEAIRVLQTQFRSLRHQLAATEAPEERIALQKKVAAFIEEAANNASAELRPVILLLLKVTIPLQEQSAEYTQLVERFHESGHGDPATLKQRSDIATRIGELENLERKNNDFIQSLATINERMEKVLVEGGVPADLRGAVMAGHRKGASRSIPGMLELRKLDAEAFALTRELYRHLDGHWGKWRIEENDFKWTDATAQERNDSILGRLQQVVDRANIAQPQK